MVFHNIMKHIRLIVIIFLLSLIPQDSYSDVKTFNVMAPLHIQTYNDKTKLEANDWQDFQDQLALMKSIGVNAVSVDIWWGLVESSDNHFDWSYYYNVVDKIKAAGLHWVPIFSFHQCGGNVGDDYTSLLPAWVWEKLVDENKNEIKSELDLKYVSEEKDGSGNRKYSNEYISLWADKYVATDYIEFMNSFKENFSDYLSITDEINVGLGPSGELRYPSYNSHDGGGYPNRGRLQCYSKLAIEDLRAEIKEKYKSIDNVNKAWNTDLKSFSDIEPPNNTDYFFASGDYKNIQYGKDIIKWYNDSLIKHGNDMLKITYNVFKDSDFSDVKIGFKMPGVHWQIANPDSPRTAEITAGLINTDPDGHIIYGNGYKYTIEKTVPTELKDKIVLHFTCLEMGNDCDPERNLNCGAYSRAQDLVFWVGEAANNAGVTVKGENALASTLCYSGNWGNIENVFMYSYYKGITILRISNICEECPDSKKYPYNDYSELIKEYSSK